MEFAIATAILTVLVSTLVVGVVVAMATDPEVAGPLWRHAPRPFVWLRRFCRRFCMVPMGVVAFTVIGTAQLGIAAGSVVGQADAGAQSAAAPMVGGTTRGSESRGDGMTEEMVTRIVTQGGAVAVLLVVLWSYRRDFFKKIDDKDRELQERREEKNTLQAVLDKSTAAITSSAIATANQTSATHRLARTVEGIERRLEEPRGVRARDEKPA